MADADNSWDLVQTMTGKEIPRADAVVLEEERWVCQDEGHLGFFQSAKSCRICGEPLVAKTVAVGFRPRD